MKLFPVHITQIKSSSWTCTILRYRVRKLLTPWIIQNHNGIKLQLNTQNYISLHHVWYILYVRSYSSFLWMVLTSTTNKNPFSVPCIELAKTSYLSPQWPHLTNHDSAIQNQLWTFIVCCRKTNHTYSNAFWRYALYIYIWGDGQHQPSFGDELTSLLLQHYKHLLYCTVLQYNYKRSQQHFNYKQRNTPNIKKEWCKSVSKCMWVCVCAYR